MKTFQSSDERETLLTSSAVQGGAVRILPRNPRRAALLSLFPGLGQIYNGEKGKGVLFLIVSAANLVFLAVMLFGGPILGLAAGVFGIFNVKPNWTAAHDLQMSSVSVLIYTLLLGLYVAYAARDAFDSALRTAKAVAPPRFQLDMPVATSGSYLCHYAFLACGLIMVLFFIAPKPPTEQITDIQLVKDDPPPPPPPPKKEPEPPKPKEPEPKPVEEPPKPQPKAEAPKPEVPAPPAPIAVATPNPSPNADVVPMAQPGGDPDAAPSTGGAPASAGSAGGGDGDEIDFGSYMAIVQKRIKKSWFPPRGNESKRITVKFKIRKNGSIGPVRLDKSSGVSIADDAAIAAVENAAPFPGLPDGSPEDIDIKFTFDYNIFGGNQGAMQQF